MRIAIVIASMASRDAKHQGAFDVPVRVPSIHVYGQADPLKRRAASQTLSSTVANNPFHNDVTCNTYLVRLLHRLASSSPPSSAPTSPPMAPSPSFSPSSMLSYLFAEDLWSWQVSMRTRLSSRTLEGTRSRHSRGRTLITSGSSSKRSLLPSQCLRCDCNALLPAVAADLHYSVSRHFRTHPQQSRFCALAYPLKTVGPFSGHSGCVDTSWSRDFSLPWAAAGTTAQHWMGILSLLPRRAALFEDRMAK